MFQSQLLNQILQVGSVFNEKVLADTGIAEEQQREKARRQMERRENKQRKKFIQK